MCIGALFVSDDREEHIVADLDRVDVEKALLCGHEFKANGVDNRPDLPRAGYRGHQGGLDLLDGSVDAQALGDPHEAEELRRVVRKIKRKDREDSKIRIRVKNEIA